MILKYFSRKIILLGFSIEDKLKCASLWKGRLVRGSVDPSGRQSSMKREQGSGRRERPVPYTHGLGLESFLYTHAILGCLGAILSGSPVLLKYLCIYDNSKKRFSNVSLVWDLSYKIQVQLHQLLDTELMLPFYRTT